MTLCLSRFATHASIALALLVLALPASVLAQESAPKPGAPTITEAPSNPSRSSDATFAWTAAERPQVESEVVNENGRTFECRLDDAAEFAPCTSPQSYTGLADGPHVFRVREVDGLEYAGEEATHEWTIDTSVPPATTPAATPAVTPSDTAPGDLTAPIVTNLVTNRKCVRGVSLGGTGGQDLSVRYRLSEDAAVTFTVLRATRGRVLERCPGPRVRFNPGQAPDAYTEEGGQQGSGRGGDNGATLGSTARVNRVRRGGSQGLNRVRLSQLAGGHKLRPGLYRLRVVARDAAGNTSEPAYVKFWILR